MCACLFNAVFFPEAFMSPFAFLFPTKVSSFSFKAPLVLVLVFLRPSSLSEMVFFFLGMSWAVIRTGQSPVHLCSLHGPRSGPGRAGDCFVPSAFPAGKVKASARAGRFCSWPCGWLLAGAALGHHGDEMLTRKQTASQHPLAGLPASAILDLQLS